MNPQHKEIRSFLSEMAPRRAKEYIRAFELPQDEENFLIACDVQNKTHIQTAMEYHVSPETVKKKRQRAYMKIADAINHNLTSRD